MGKKTIETAQTLFMMRLRDSLPGNISLVDELADLLGVSNDSAYRRMRGETQLSIEEIALICKYFKISFDSFIHSGDNDLVNFRYHRMDNDRDGFKAYFKSLNDDLEKLLAFGDSTEVIFAAEDIPVFHHFSFPELTAFKMFYWNKSILNSKEFEDKKFEAGCIDQELIDLGASILDRYSKIPSIEIWSDDTANSTIKQIEFYWESGIFKTKEDALLICDQLSLMLSKIKRMAEAEIKFDKNNQLAATKNNYALYHSDVMIGNNCVLVTTGPVKSTYLSYHTFNTIVTQHVNFCAETDSWLKNLIRKSNLISGVAEKQRYRYFKKIEEMMKKLKDKIEQE